MDVRAACGLHGWSVVCLQELQMLRASACLGVSYGLTLAFPVSTAFPSFLAPARPPLQEDPQPAHPAAGLPPGVQEGGEPDQRGADEGGGLVGAAGHAMHAGHAVCCAVLCLLRS